MALIVVVEDDAVMRLMLEKILKNQGHDVITAVDGSQGMDLIGQIKPHLIISDVQMPKMDGFALLAAVRQNDKLATTPFILLTSLHERSDVRQGMAAGADDYLSKPFSAEELREAVDAQINKMIRTEIMRVSSTRKAVTIELGRQRASINKLYEDRLARALSEQWPSSDANHDLEGTNYATVLYADIRDYAQWNAKLSSTELRDLINFMYGSVGDTVHLFGAHHLQFVGEGMLCVFVDADDTASVSHSLRAVRAAMGLVDATRRVNVYADSRFSERGLPPFAITVALHSGSVAFTQLVGLTGNTVYSTPVGATVTTALRLFQATPAVPWSMACSVKTARLITGGVKFGARALVQVPGMTTGFEIVEILSLEE